MGLGAFVLAASLGPTPVSASAVAAYACQPSLRFFCANIHVACAGKTRLRTRAFHLVLEDDAGTMRVPGAGEPRRGSLVRGGDRLLRFENSRDWLRLDDDDRYVYRIHGDRRAVMSHGECAPTSTAAD